MKKNRDIVQQISVYCSSGSINNGNAFPLLQSAVTVLPKLSNSVGHHFIKYSNIKFVSYSIKTYQLVIYNLV